MAKLCIFCGKKAKSKEHLWGKWLQGIYQVTPNPKIKAVHFENRRGEDGRVRVARGFGEAAGHSLNRTISDMVCRGCNSGWMSVIQDRAKAPFIKAIDPNHIFLSPEEQVHLRDWLLLKHVLLQEKCEPQEGLDFELERFGLSQQQLETEAARIRRHQSEQFFRCREELSGWEVYLARTPNVDGALGAHNYLPIAMIAAHQSGNQVGGLQIHTGFCNILFIGNITAVIRHLPAQMPLPFSLSTFASEVASYRQDRSAFTPLIANPNAAIRLPKRDVLQHDIETDVFSELPTGSSSLPIRHNFDQFNQVIREYS